MSLERKANELYFQESDNINSPPGKIRHQIESALRAKEIDPKALVIDESIIKDILSLSFWNADKGKVYTLVNNVLNAYTEKSAFKHLCETNGPVFNSNKIRELAEEKKFSKPEITALVKSCEAYLLDHLVVYSQRSAIAMCVDMFAKVPRVEMYAEQAKIFFIHKPYPVKTKPNPKIIEDYKNHFPELDAFLKFLVSSRFARDRKKSFLWFKCTSDWGKGFLMGIFSELELSVELSVKEIEKMFEGAPVGRSMADFKSSMVLVIDEFKTVKSELKQLQSTINISPKNQLSFKAEIFSKVFFSAESVDSLVGESGVEDQFINRFNLFDFKGEITKRELFIKHGASVYFDVVVSYVAETLNDLIKVKQKQGRAKAEKEAESYLNEFMCKYGLGLTHNALSESIGDIAKEVAEILFNESKIVMSEIRKKHIKTVNSDMYLIMPGAFMDKWINESIPHSEKITISRKKHDIFAVLSADGKGVINRRIQGFKSTKSVLISPGLYQAID